MIGTLYVIAAPSGAGKTSLIQTLLEHVDNLVVSVSYTTRPQRSAEQDGVNYYFVDQTQFDEMVQDNLFLEHATVFGNSYATSKQWVEEKLRQGTDVLLEIDWQGAQQIKQLIPNCISVFIMPPSSETLQQRLQGRGQDEPEVIAKRMAAARNEMSHYQEFDYLVVNDDFATALADLETIVAAQRLRCSYQQQKQAKLLANLLKPVK